MFLINHNERVMAKKAKLGIIICERYDSCSGGKCLRALREREGAFDVYAKNEDVQSVGYTPEIQERIEPTM